jgi:hypothetical protein
MVRSGPTVLVFVVRPNRLFATLSGMRSQSELGIIGKEAIVINLLVLFTMEVYYTQDSIHNC